MCLTMQRRFSLKEIFCHVYIKYNVTKLVTTNFYPENNEYFFCSISIIYRASETGSVLRITHLMHEEIKYENEKRKTVNQL